MTRTPYTLIALILDLIVVIVMVGLALFLTRDLEAAEYDIWFKMPGDKCWQQAVEISTSSGLGPVEKYIPDGAIIAVRDRETWSLTVLTRGR